MRSGHSEPTVPFRSAHPLGRHCPARRPAARWRAVPRDDPRGPAAEGTAAGGDTRQLRGSIWHVSGTAVISTAATLGNDQGPVLGIIPAELGLGRTVRSLAGCGHRRFRTADIRFVSFPQASRRPATMQHAGHLSCKKITLSRSRCYSTPLSLIRAESVLRSPRPRRPPLAVAVSRDPRPLGAAGATRPLDAYRRPSSPYVRTRAAARRHGPRLEGLVQDTGAPRCRCGHRSGKKISWQRRLSLGRDVAGGGCELVGCQRECRQARTESTNVVTMKRGRSPVGSGGVKAYRSSWPMRYEVVKPIAYGPLRKTLLVRPERQGPAGDAGTVGAEVTRPLRTMPTTAVMASGYRAGTGARG